MITFPKQVCAFSIAGRSVEGLRVLRVVTKVVNHFGITSYDNGVVLASHFLEGKDDGIIEPCAEEKAL
jgi:hypothetical protein